ncbi:hypothetical protein N7492_008033 [Penicillium capsulatum]|uniref:Rhodopsin domain-containing protein n=1 Tax=Penicillium capsulatum TaxID=69766 RepID=A0A9W9LGZ3_9EURO|nr:hypothetical protein N7492_008033 [Penicillium capsulatum]KAJ6105441.1 hypothetical protein N7512_008958 [Penicillium capsulatum]
MGPYVPPGQSPPFEVVDEYHHAAYIIIATALGLVISLVCFLIRLYVRLMLIPPLARDDLVLLGATTVAVIQSTLIFYASSRGFGTSITLLDEDRVRQIQVLIATSDAFALVILYLSKCCVVAIYLRLTPQKSHNRASWATFALCTGWLIPAIFLLLVNCELNQPWRTEGGQCRNLHERWQFIAALDVVTEILLFSLAVALLHGLFMSVKRKLAIGFAFIFRFPLIIFTIFHLSTLNAALSDRDVTLAAIKPTLWLQIEVHYTLVACSVFCLRPFMAAVSTNYGTAGDSNLESSISASRSQGTKESSKSGSGSGSNSASRSRSLSRMRRKRTGTTSRAGNTEGVTRSTSKERLCLDGSGHGACLDDASQGNSHRHKPSAASRETIRAPARMSMFPLGTSSKTSTKRNKGKARADPSVAQEPDSIELMPQLHRQCDGNENEEPGDDPDKMVIRKEVQYSVQYEYDEARRRGQSVPQKSSTDAIAYV